MSTITTRAGKGSPLTNNEVDANFTNLNTDKAELSGATFTGDVASTGFSGDITGAILFQAKAGEALTKGDPVYISGISGNQTVVSKADANDANKMPCFGIVDATVSINANCSVVTFGTLSSLDTSAFGEGDELYISDTGTLSTTAPTGEASQLQKIAKVTRSHASSGSIKVMGAGRTNATPNLDDGKFFLGNSSNQSASATFSTSVTGIALPLSGGAMTGAITTNSTFDGRDVATDGSKLDGIESGATADQTAAEIKTAYESNADTNAFTDADESKLDGIEASADVTDAINVEAAGGLMDSELTSIASVKALNQGVATTDSPTFAGLTVTGEITANGGIALGDGDVATFGDSDDLSIFHAGGTTYLTNTTGSLVLRTDSFRVLNTANSEQILHGDANGAVTAYYDNSVKLATTSTGIDVTGRAVVGSGSFDGGGVIHNYGSDGNSRSWWTKTDTHGYGDFAIRQSTTQTGSTYQTRLLIDSSGNVGVGTSSPSTKLHLGGTAPLDSIIRQDSTVSGTNWEIGEREAGKWQIFEDDSDSVVATFMSSGNVGIGNSSPVEMLTIGSTSDTNVRAQFLSSTTGANTIQFGDGTGASAYSGYINYTHSDNALVFATSSTERMRISSAGHTMFATTDDAPGAGNTQSGVAIRGGSDNRSFFSASSNYAMHLNRNTNDGEILYFAKNGTAVGSIGTNAATMYVSAPQAGGMKYSYLNSTNAVMLPVTTTGAYADGLHDLGYSAARFKDLYLSGAITAGGGISASPLVMSLATNNSNCDVTMQSANSSSVTRLRNGTNDFQVHTNGAERMRINSGGVALFGTTSENGPEGITINGNSANTPYILINTGASANTHVYFRYNSGTVGTITTTTTSTSYNTSSDQRLKENIADADDAGSKIDAIQVRKYDWKADGSHHDYGMIAQELQAVAPEAVSGDADSEEMMGVDYSKLVPMLIKEIQSLRNRVAQLEE